MLAELRIRNFAIIEEAAISFGAGLNVLSGETGAGKTIIMNALALLLGGRASPDVVRVDQKEALVEAMFELDGEAPPPELAQLCAEGGRELLIRRSIGEGGRSRATINDELATVAKLARIGAALVQIYGQHEQQALLRIEAHLPILDGYAGLEAMLATYREAYDRADEIRVRLADLERRERERSQLLELARFQLAELERAGLAPGEDEELAAARTILVNAARLSKAAAEAFELLYGDGAALDAAGRAANRLNEPAALDPALAQPLEMIAAARANLEEAAHSLRGYADRIEADPARLEQVETRIQELQRIKRKYGGSIESALAALDNARAEISELESIGESKSALDREMAHARARVAELGRELSSRRNQAARELKRRMEVELKSLGMRNAVFEARIAELPQSDATLIAEDRAMGAAGCDTVEFYFSPNLGQPPMALARIASGGELSRVMLALKRLEAQRRGVATIIFDEVDAGIGGAVAEVVGRKLKELARYHQVLCITHLPQIAAFADRHFVVEKIQRRGATHSRVAALDRSQRAGELARMIGGAEVTDTLLRAAKELLTRAQA